MYRVSGLKLRGMVTKIFFEAILSIAPFIGFTLVQIVLKICYSKCRNNAGLKWLRRKVTLLTNA